MASLQTFGVIRPTRAEDRIWDAVERAIDAGISPEQFRREAAEAWEHSLKERARDARAELLLKE